MTALDEFKHRLHKEWLVPFCTARGYTHEGFDGSGIGELSSADAADFMQAVDSGLVQHKDGIFVSAQSKADEQIFWQCGKNTTPRKVTLWLEPIITIAGLMRLKRDYLWPENLLGLQSKTWAFDLVAYSANDELSEVLVCEVKKSIKEIYVLLGYMQKHLSTPASRESELRGSERNAFKKVLAMRRSKSEIFWALGPDNYGFVFKIGRTKSGELVLSETSSSELAVRT